MTEGTFRLKKLCPPFGTPESPIWEFGYDEQVRVVGGLCTVRSSAMRDRLVKMGYELAAEGEVPPAGTEPGVESGEPPKEPETQASESGPAEPAAVTPDPAAAPEEQPKPGGPPGGA